MRAEVLRRDAARDREDLAARHRGLERGGHRRAGRAPRRRGSAPSAPRRSRRRRRAASRGTPAPSSAISSGIGARLALALALRARVRAHVQQVDDAGQLVLAADRDVDGDAARRRAAPGAASSARKKSARSRSSMFTKTTRASPSSSAQLPRRGPSRPRRPSRALTTTSAPSTTRSAAIASPWKPGSPGRVDQVDLAPLPLARHERRAERHLPRCCSSVVPVGDGGARLDRAEPVDLARLEEHRLDERRLARPAVADDGDVADLPGLDEPCARVPPRLGTGES